jgi:hypothetical protein
VEVTSTSQLNDGDTVLILLEYNSDQLPITAFTGSFQSYEFALLNAERQKQLGIKKTERKAQCQSKVVPIPAKLKYGPWIGDEKISISSINRYLDNLHFESNVVKSFQHQNTVVTTVKGSISHFCN